MWTIPPIDCEDSLNMAAKSIVILGHQKAD